jgi:hypothetical protein
VANSTSINLENSVDGNDLYESHLRVTAYWSPFWDKMELYYDNLSGEMWTPDEKLLFKRKKKAPVVINDLKPAERTILGLFIQNKYDVKFAPREEAQDISDVLQQLYAWTAYTQDWAFKDIELVRQAWCGGVAYQEVFVKVVPGEEPTIITQTLNPFSIGWDPESRDLINREDAEFVDRDTWVSFQDLAEMWPDKITTEDALSNQGATAFQQSKTYADRTAEFYDNKNNRYKVTERLYKVRKTKWKAADGKTSLDVQDPQNRKKYEQEGYQLHRQTEEQLFLAIICPAWQIGEYLYNGPYHCQPRDLFSKKIIWPYLELVAESVNGVPGGFVQHLVQINRLKNSAVSNLFHAQKHASSTALLRKKRLFGADEDQAKAFDKNHSDADRVFIAADAADLGADISAVPKGIVSQDTDKTLEIASNSFQNISSTPPALQGQAESSSTSGILNSQRIEQSFVQLQVFIANIKHFLKRRAELVYYYWREYFTEPMKIRIVGGQQTQPAAAPGQPQQPAPTHIAINQPQPVMGWNGQPTGAIEKINDINAARYDVDIEDSYQSPTYRAKRMQQLTDLMQKSNIDPNLYSILFNEWIQASDMSEDVKQIAKQDAQKKQDQANQPPPPPQPKPANISFAFKGEDFNNPWVQAIVSQEGILPPAMVQQLQQQPPPPPPTTATAQAAPAAPEAQANPFELQKSAADAELQQAKVQGQHLENVSKIHEIEHKKAQIAHQKAQTEAAHLTNAQKMQEVADAEAQAMHPEAPTDSGLVPSVDKSFQEKPDAFAPRLRNVQFHRGPDGKIQGASIMEHAG